MSKWEEEFENTKGVINIRKRKNRQSNGQFILGDSSEIHEALSNRIDTLESNLKKRKKIDVQQKSSLKEANKLIAKFPTSATATYVRNKPQSHQFNFIQQDHR